jgi:hypothetical protein
MTPEGEGSITMRILTFFVAALICAGPALPSASATLTIFPSDPGIPSCTISPYNSENPCAG